MKNKPMQESELLKHSQKWDRTGLIVSILCIVHCLALPFLVLFIPSLRTLFSNPFLEASLLTLAIAVGSISFFTSFRQHRMLQPMILGIMGVIFLSLSLYLEFYQVIDQNHSSSHGLFKSLDIYTILGGLFLVAGHIWNIHACHCFCDKSCDHKDHYHSH